MIEMKKTELLESFGGDTAARYVGSHDPGIGRESKPWYGVQVQGPILAYEHRPSHALGSAPMGKIAKNQGRVAAVSPVPSRK
jgi:hypothetical protein